MSTSGGGSGGVDSISINGGAAQKGAVSVADMMTTDTAQTTSTQKIFSPSTNALIPLSIKGLAGQSVHLLDISSSAGTGDLFNVDQNGTGTFGGSILTFGGLDRANAATLPIAGANATAIQLGRAGMNIGMYAAAPVARAAAITQAATTASTNVTPFGYTTAAQADSIPTRINAIIVALQNIGLTL